MANTKTKEVEIYSPEVIELMVEYRKGWANKENATRDIMKLTGLSAPVCGALLDMAKSQSVTQIRGYSKVPEYLQEARARKRKQEP